MAPVREYAARIDAKKRVTLRGARYIHYHLQEYSNGGIVLEPRVLAMPFEVSRKTLAQMDSSTKNLEKGKVSKPIDLAEFSAKLRTHSMFSIRLGVPQMELPGRKPGTGCLAGSRRREMPYRHFRTCSSCGY